MEQLLNWDFISKLKSVFSKKEIIDSVVSIIEDAISEYHTKQKKSTTFIKSFNKLVEQVKNEGTK